MVSYDFQCEECAEVFEKRLPRDRKKWPIIQCPICSSGAVHKIVVMPATVLNWKDARSSDGVPDMSRRFRSSARPRKPKDDRRVHRQRREQKEKEAA